VAYLFQKLKNASLFQFEAQHAVLHLLCRGCTSLRFVVWVLPYSSDLSNRGGMIAPMVGGSLLMMGRSVPVYTSVVTFAITGICVLLLKENEGDGSRGNAEIAVH
jgi:hypothetical protein